MPMLPGRARISIRRTLIVEMDYIFLIDRDGDRQLVVQIYNLFSLKETWKTDIYYLKYLLIISY